MKILYLACLLVMTGLSGNRDANADTPIIAAAIDKIIPADADVTDTNLISLGPIGVRVETDHKADRHPRSNSNSGIVRYIFENSLAQGKLGIGDEIIDVPFDFLIYLSRRTTLSTSTRSKRFGIDWRFFCQSTIP